MLPDMTRPKRSTNQGSKKQGTGGQTGAARGSRGHAPQKNTAQGRGGATRDTTRPVRERRDSEASPASPAQTKTDSRKTDSRPAAGERRYGSAAPKTTNFKAGTGRPTPPKPKKSLPELKRVSLNALPGGTVFIDRDGEKLTFPDSTLRRVAAQILSEKRKHWRYRPFSFPLFTDKGHEQSFHFDFYVYDAEDSVIRLILVVPSESREVWDKIGRFKRQYPMYHYELWTPEKLAQLSGPRGRLEF